MATLLQLTEQGKTGLKGSYLSISTSITYFIAHITGIIPDDLIVNLVNALNVFALIGFISAFFATMLYYIKIEYKLLSFILWLRQKTFGFQSRALSEYKNGINHPFVINNTEQVFSRCYFSCSILFFLGTFLSIEIVPIIFSLYALSVIVFVISTCLKDFLVLHDKVDFSVMNGKRFRFLLLKNFNWIILEVMMVFPLAVIFYNDISNLLAICLYIFTNLVILSIREEWHQTIRAYFLLFLLKVLLTRGEKEKQVMEPFSQFLHQGRWEEASNEIHKYIRDFLPRIRKAYYDFIKDGAQDLFKFKQVIEYSGPFKKSFVLFVTFVNEIDHFISLIYDLMDFKDINLCKKEFEVLNEFKHLFEPVYLEGKFVDQNSKEKYIVENIHKSSIQISDKIGNILNYIDKCNNKVERILFLNGLVKIPMNISYFANNTLE